MQYTYHYLLLGTFFYQTFCHYKKRLYLCVH